MELPQDSGSPRRRNNFAFQSRTGDWPARRFMKSRAELPFLSSARNEKARSISIFLVVLVTSANRYHYGRERRV
jgi:hypothetical protein